MCYSLINAKLLIQKQKRKKYMFHLFFIVKIYSTILQSKSRKEFGCLHKQPPYLASCYSNYKYIPHLACKDANQVNHSSIQRHSNKHTRFKKLSFSICFIDLPILFIYFSNYPLIYNANKVRQQHYYDVGNLLRRIHLTAFFVLCMYF